MKFFKNYIYLSNIDGATAIEYGLIAAGIALAIVTVIFGFGEELGLMFGTMEPAIDNMAGRLD